MKAAYHVEIFNNQQNQNIKKGPFGWLENTMLAVDFTLKKAFGNFTSAMRF